MFKPKLASRGGDHIVTIFNSIEGIDNVLLCGRDVSLGAMNKWEKHKVILAILVPRRL
jgi:hypothetical protein